MEVTTLLDVLFSLLNFPVFYKLIPLDYRDVLLLVQVNLAVIHREMMEFHIIVIHAFGLLLVLSRFLNFIGLRKSSGVSAERFMSGITTNALLITGAVLLLLRLSNII
jgi:uncharacterized membrane protein YecN with MAPEG domain